MQNTQAAMIICSTVPEINLSCQYSLPQVETPWHSSTNWEVRSAKSLASSSEMTCFPWVESDRASARSSALSGPRGRSKTISRLNRKSAPCELSATIGISLSKPNLLGSSTTEGSISIRSFIPPGPILVSANHTRLNSEVCATSWQLASSFPLVIKNRR